nr:MAG TPA: hypothetical protein [Caudoviricetes sp.]
MSYTTLQAASEPISTIPIQYHARATSLSTALTDDKSARHNSCTIGVAVATTAATTATLRLWLGATRTVATIAHATRKP